MIISSDAYNRQRPDVILMAVTSQMRSAGDYGDVPVSQWKKAGLLKPSVIKPICTTVEKGLVLKKLGRLANEDRTTLNQALRKILGE